MSPSCNDGSESGGTPGEIVPCGSTGFVHSQNLGPVPRDHAENLLAVVEQIPAVKEALRQRFPHGTPTVK